MLRVPLPEQILHVEFSLWVLIGMSPYTHPLYGPGVLA